VIYAVGDTIYIHLATPVLKLTHDILEASPSWPRDGSKLHVEMRNWLNELRSEIQHREAGHPAPTVISSPDINDDLR
jgi:hypothetical protein